MAQDASRQLMDLLSRVGQNGASVGATSPSSNLLAALKTSVPEESKGGSPVIKAVNAIEYEDNVNRFGVTFASELDSSSEHRGSRLPSSDVIIDVAKDVSYINQSPLEQGTVTLSQNEFCYHPGRLVSSNSDYLAYAFKGNGKIRVFHRETGQKAMLKGHNMIIQDLELFPLNHHPYLISVGSDGLLFVWKLLEFSHKDDEIPFKIIFQVRSDKLCPNRFTKVMWDPEDPNVFYTVTVHCEVYRVNIDVATESGATVITHDERSFVGVPGFTRLAQLNQPIRDIRLVDGQIALATDDGLVRFYNSKEMKPLTASINVNDSCPVTRMFFHGRYLITCSLYNTVIQLWDWKQKQLFQSIHFVLKQETLTPMFNSVDFGSGFLFVGNVARRSLYVLHLGEECFDFMSEFPLSQPILSSSQIFIDESVTFYALQTNSVSFYEFSQRQLYDCENVESTQGNSLVDRIESGITQENCLPRNELIDAIPRLEPRSSVLLSPKAIITKSGFASPNVTGYSLLSPQEKSSDYGTFDKHSDVISFLQKWTREQEQRDKDLLAKFNESLNSNVASIVESVVKTEVPKVIQKVLAKSVQDVFKNNEKILQESLAKVIAKTPLLEKVSSEVASTVEGTVRTVFEEKAIPAYERASNAMFKQLNEAWQNSPWSTGDVMNTLNSLKNVVKVDTRIISDELIKNLQLVLPSMIAKELGGESNKPPTSESVDNESVDPIILQREVDALVDRGLLDGAFVKALSSGYLPVVVGLCSRLNPKDILSDQAPQVLSQPVVVSLIQQLSLQLESEFEMKLAWLRDALFALQPSDPIISNVVPIVLTALVESLEIFCSKSNLRDPAQIRKAKLIIQMTQSLISTKE